MLCGSIWGEREVGGRLALVKDVDAFNDEHVEEAERQPWNMSHGPNEWKNKKKTKVGVYETSRHG
jgi:hypothetical protein